MSTATKTTTLPARRLPGLSTDPVPVALEAMGGEAAELGKRRKAAVREAVHLRSASQDAARAVEAAAEKDREAFRQAALDDKPTDPGRAHELKAQAAAEKAHRAAEGATLKANALAVKVRIAVTGEQGAEALSTLDARMTKALERLREHCGPVEVDLAELAALAAAKDQIERARRPNRRGIPAPRSTGTDALPKVHVNGGPNSPAHLVELLKVYEPRQER
jgi:hypothetical protein